MFNLFKKKNKKDSWILQREVLTEKFVITKFETIVKNNIISCIIKYENDNFCGIDNNKLLNFINIMPYEIDITTINYDNFLVAVKINLSNEIQFSLNIK